MTEGTVLVPTRPKRDRRYAWRNASGVLSRSARQYGLAVVLVGVVTAAGIPLHRLLPGPDLSMLYLLAIGVAGAILGRGPSLLASILSVLAYDFLFVPPFHAFAIAEERYVLTFGMMFAVGLITSSLTARVRKGQIEELRSALLSTVSHDLRTPLAAITGAATTLRDGANLAPAQRLDLLDTICEEAARLERLVTNLLDMTRLESGLEAKREWVPLEEIVGSALSRVETQLEGRDVRIDLPEDLPLISVDPLLMEQVLVNLLENVAKHTPAATSVDIRARVAHRDIWVEVADRGPGVPAGTETRLFEKFFRGPHVNAAGAGLGLAICRGIAKAHGGTIGVENGRAGGAIFRIVIPLSTPAPPLAREADADDGAQP